MVSTSIDNNSIIYNIYGDEFNDDNGDTNNNNNDDNNNNNNVPANQLKQV